LIDLFNCCQIVFVRLFDTNIHRLITDYFLQKKYIMKYLHFGAYISDKQIYVFRHWDEIYNGIMTKQMNISILFNGFSVMEFLIQTKES